MGRVRTAESSPLLMLVLLILHTTHHEIAYYCIIAAHQATLSDEQKALFEADAAKLYAKMFCASIYREFPPTTDPTTRTLLYHHLDPMTQRT